MATFQELLDQAVRNITNTTAQSRFTRTPIRINNTDQTVASLLNSLKEFNPTINQTPSEGASTGTYTPSNQNIDVSLYGNNPSYKDFAGTLHHEDIHALLDKSGNTAPKVDITNAPILDQLKELFYYRTPEQATQAFNKGNRSGDIKEELPAYVGAYKPNELPGMDEAARQRYLNLLRNNLPENGRQSLTRIINSYDASQKVK